MKISVLGAYQTKFGELWNKSLEDLLLEASMGAIEDANLLPSKINIAYIGNKLGGTLLNQHHVSALLAEMLKIQAPVVRVEAACASGGIAVAQACLAITSGMYDVALVVGVEKMTDASYEEIATALMSAASPEEQQSGLTFVGLYALMAQAYLKQFGAKIKDLATPSVKNHYHASLNDKAHFRFPVTQEQVLNSPMIAEPLRMLQCSPITDGAAALILANPKIKNKKRNNVYITASTQVNINLSLNKRQNLYELKSSQLAAKAAYEQSGMGPKDLSLLEVHDCFSIAEIMALEDLGLCRKGEGYLLERNGELKLGGRRPVNLSGGLKACGHPVGATGIKQIVEIYGQLLGRAGKRQTNQPKVGLTHNVGGTGGTAVIHILQK